MRIKFRGFIVITAGLLFCISLSSVAKDSGDVTGKAQPRAVNLGSFFKKSATAHTYAPAVKIAGPAVVSVFTDRVKQSIAQARAKPNGKTKRRRRYTLGSGVIMDKDGHILTNYHVIRRARKILVALTDGRRVQAKLIGTDRETDLALIKIDLNDLAVIQTADSDNLHVGEVVLAIGNPFGLGQTVTQGIISAIGRSAVGINELENYIQTDAAINPGNSGGALVNTEGKLIGINTAIYSRSGGYQGVGFAIP
ncbi:MAG: trypsin-like peptidase domain-containing protein, partial [Gammaproteobacteria bacterium]|nr:trypsin-like peptidase domain-containing protein [Gammaproteobacteria bacterium]